MRFTNAPRLVLAALVLAIACDQGTLPTTTFSSGDGTGSGTGGQPGTPSTPSTPATPSTPGVPSTAPATLNLLADIPALLSINDSVRAVAEVRSASGVLLSTPVTWSSSNPAVLSVSGATIRAVGLGTATLTARADSLSLQRTVTVVTAAPAAIVFTSVPRSTTVGDSVQLVAEARDRNGQRVAGAVVTYGSATTSVAAGSAAGGPWIKGVGVGRAKVYAVSGILVADTALDVLPPIVARVTVSPASLTMEEMEAKDFSVRAFTASGFEVYYRPVTVTIDNPSVVAATTTQALGKVAGTANITATIDGHSATLAVQVTPAVVTGIGVSPTAISLENGTTRTLTAFTNSRFGLVPGQPIAWTSADPTIVTVSASGVVTALKVGSTMVTASSNGYSANASVSVTTPPVATVTASVASTSINVGDTTRVVAVAKSATGLVLTGKTFSYRTSNNAAAIVSQSGLIRAVAKGQAVITVSCDGKSADILITVN